MDTVDAAVTATSYPGSGDWKQFIITDGSGRRLELNRISAATAADQAATFLLLDFRSRF